MSMPFLCHRRTTALAVMSVATNVGLSWQKPQTDPALFHERVAVEQPRVALITDEYLGNPTLFTSIRTASAETIIVVCLLSSLPPGRNVWNTLDNLEFDVLTTLNELAKCLESLQAGRFCQSVLLEAHVGQALNETFPGGSDLTPTERRVLKLMVDGKNGAEIADALHISKKTVNNHKHIIAQKLNVSGGPGSLTRYVLLHREQLLAFLT